MTTLEAKFEALESQLTDQQTAIVNALDSILTALGAPPPTATVTLGDTLAMMIAMNNNLIGMAIAQGSFHASALELLALINTNTDTMITNNSLNAQRMIAAIMQTACSCTTDAPLVGPVLDVTPTSLVDEAKCRRIQYFLSIFSAIIDNISNYGGAGAAITSGTIAEIIIAAAAAGALVGGEVGAVAGPPGIVITAIVGVIAAIVAALGSAYLFTLQTEWQQAPLHDELVAALFAADSADAGSEAFYDVVNASEVLDTIFKPLINALWWNGWSNDIYSGIPEVDDSAFDGTICVDATEGCQETVMTIREDGYAVAYFGTTTDPGDPSVTTVAGNFNGYRFKIISMAPEDTEVVVAIQTPSGVGGGNLAIFNASGQSVVCEIETISVYFQSRYANQITSCVVEVCTPGSF